MTIVAEQCLRKHGLMAGPCWPSSANWMVPTAGGPAAGAAGAVAPALGPAGVVAPVVWAASVGALLASGMPWSWKTDATPSGWDLPLAACAVTVTPKVGSGGAEGVSSRLMTGDAVSGPRTFESIPSNENAAVTGEPRLTCLMLVLCNR